MATLARDEARRTGAYVLVHDPTGSYDTDPYRRIWSRAGGVHRHESADAAVRALSSAPRGAHVIDVADGGEVLRAGLRVGAASMARAKDGKYNPVIVIVDEAVGAEGVQSHGLDREWLDAIVKRRHLGIGIGWTGQSTYVAHRALLMQSTELYVFRLVDPADHKRLQALGLTRDEARRVAHLPDRAALVFRNSRPEGSIGPAPKNRHGDS
jgi:hypothetical protein